MSYTFAEREEIKQAQVQSLLQGKAEFEAKRAQAAAVTAPTLNSFGSPFGTVQADRAAPEGAVGISPFGTTAAREEVKQLPAKSEPAPSMLLPLIIFFAFCTLVYLLLRRLNT